MRSHSARNDLDRLLDRLAASEPVPSAGDLAPLLHPARAAAAAFDGSLPSGVAQRHLATLRADRARNVVVAPPLRRRGIRTSAVVLVTAIVLMLGSSAAVAASSKAVPGDALYGVKRAVERVSLAMHHDPVGRAGLHLQFAQTRLDEVRLLVARGDDPAEAAAGLEDALSGAQQEALHAVALGKDADALLAHVQEMIAKHIAVLEGVLGKVPDAAKDAIQHAIDNANKAKANVQKGHGGKPDEPGPPVIPPGQGGGPPDSPGGGNPNK